MGSTASSSVLNEDVMEDYLLLSYLSKREIFRLYEMFCSLCTVDSNGVLRNLQKRFPVENVEQLFPELLHNPFKDRIFRVFSSLKDDKMSFEDTLDLCSALSENCPAQVKAAYAFQIFDFDEDNSIGKQDLQEAMDRLIGGVGSVSSSHKDHIIKIIVVGYNTQKTTEKTIMLLDKMDFTSNGSIGELEFVHAVAKMPEFSPAFCFRL